MEITMPKIPKNFFNAIEFWARESQTPLFRITDIKRTSINYTLVLYKAGISSFYYINNSEETRIKEGHSYFLKQENIPNYEQIAEREIAKANLIIGKSKKIKYAKLDDISLYNEFEIIRNAINQYFSVYSKTEAYNFKSFENSVEDFKNAFEKIGKIRFEMRKLIPSLFKIIIGNILYQLAKRNNLKLQEEIYFYTLDELKKLFLNNEQVPEEEILNRKKGNVVINYKNKFHLLTGEDFKKIEEFIDDEFNVKSESIKGFSACPGEITGIVRLILHNKENIGNDLSKIKEGEILVTDMTKPDMVLACKKASAIITDEGGILCHAAIISREFGIPCIVGTKIATNFFKTGDKVKVNANKGIIIKLQ